METDQRGLLADEKEEDEISSKKQKITQIEQPEIFIDKVNFTIPLQHTNHKAQSTSVATERSKEETDGKMPFSTFHEKRPLFVNEWQNMEKKEAFLGTEESKGFNSNMHKFQGKEPLVCIESYSKETSCLKSNVHGGTESSGECNKAKISLIGLRRQKNGRYGAVITDKIRHKQVWLGTFDTVEEASQAYWSKKSEFEKLSQHGNKDNEPKENLHQIQQLDQTLDTASVSRINSHGTTTHIIEVHRNNWSGKEPESSKETICLMANVHGTESSDECNASASNSKAKISLLGVRRQKNGRYGAVITDTTRHKQVWLGTFDTVEEASQAYFSKKSELEKAKLNQQRNEENTPKKNCDQIQQPESPVVLASLSVADVQTLDTASVGMRNESIVGVHKSKTSEKEIDVNVKHEHENVNCELKSAGGSEIDVPISNSSNRGTEQRIDSHEIGTAEEAFRAYQSKRFDLQISKEVELQREMPTDSSAREKQEGQEDNEDLRMGEWVQLPGNRAVKFSLKLGLPIIDNYGSLLGEFSTLDDLSICK